MAEKYEDWCKENCPYYPDCYGAGVCNYVQSLLKEQEPVKPEVYYVGQDKYKFYRCPACKTAWYYKGNYCLCCGRPVKWDV